MLQTPEQITAEWLTGALRPVASAGARVTGFRPSELGMGKVGRCIRYQLIWSEPQAGPASVIGKFPAADERSRRTGVGSDVYRRELLFYQRLAPKVRMSVPECHLAEFEEDSGGFVLLLSDAAPAVPRDQLAGASPGDVARALEELVRLQAPFWGGAGLAGQDWLPTPAATAARRTAAIYQLMSAGFLARYGPRLTPPTVAVLERFTAHVRGWGAAAQAPFTLSHGDFRLDNLLFDGDRLTVVDWQTVALGPATNDVAYLIGGALPTDTRRRHEDELYRHYHQALSDAGVGHPQDWTAYRRSTLAGLHMTVVGAMLVAQEPSSDEMFLSMAERHAAHVSDLEAFDALDQ